MFNYVFNSVANIFYLIGSLLPFTQQNAPVPKSNEVPFYEYVLDELNSNKNIGSRSLVVQPDNNEPRLLLVRLRDKLKCSALQHLSHQSCACWSNSEKRDQPAIQGDPRAFFKYFAKSLDKRLGFFIQDGILCARMPSPAHLKERLQSMGKENLFEVIENGQLLGVKKYLALMAEGKHPITGVEKEREDLFLYQNYFHDVFNHLLLWLFIPDEYRTIIKDKINTFIIFSKFMEESLSPRANLLWQLVEHRVAYHFDIAIGDLNNHLFHCDCWLVNDYGDDKLIINKKYREKIYKALSASLNLGLIHEKRDGKSDNISVVNIDININIKKLSFEYLKSNIEMLIKNDENISMIIDHNPELAGLREFSLEELKEIFQEIESKLNIHFPSNNYDFSPIATVDEFADSISANIRKLR